MSLQAQLHLMRKRIVIPVTQFTFGQGGFTPAGTLTITKGAIISGTEIGLSADANGAALHNNGIGATRTGITGFVGTLVSGDTLLVSGGSTGGTLATISTFGRQGFTVTAGALCFCTLPLQEMDRGHPIRLRVRFATRSLTATHTHTWIVLYKKYILGDTTDGVMAAPATALNTVIAVATDTGVDYCEQATAWGKINGGSIGDTVDGLEASVELDATDASETIYLTGLEVEFTPNITRRKQPIEAESFVA